MTSISYQSEYNIKLCQHRAEISMMVYGTDSGAITVDTALTGVHCKLLGAFTAILLI